MNGISSKVGFSAAAGAATAVLVWIAGLLGLDIPSEISAAITTLIIATVGYLVPETRGVPVANATVTQVVTENSGENQL